MHNGLTLSKDKASERATNSISNKLADNNEKTNRQLNAIYLDSHPEVSQGQLIKVTIHDDFNRFKKHFVT